MKNRRYVQEKLSVALLTLAEGDGTFRERLEGATVSALIRLNRGDLDSELDEQLDFILSLSAENIENGRLVRDPDPGERRRLVEAMMSLLEELACAA